jgi:hypothetical protein
MRAEVLAGCDSCEISCDEHRFVSPFVYLLAESPVVLKLAEECDRGVARLRTRDPGTAEAIRLALSMPASMRAFREWLDALDYLLLTPSAAMLMNAYEQAVGKPREPPWWGKIGSATQVTSRCCLEDWPPRLDNPGPLAYSHATPEDDARPSVHEYVNDAAESSEFLELFWRLGKLNEGVSKERFLPRALCWEIKSFLLENCILHAVIASAGSAVGVLRDCVRLSEILTPASLERVVYTALRRLYSAEAGRLLSAEESSAGLCLPSVRALRHCLALNRITVDGIAPFAALKDDCCVYLLNWCPVEKRELRTLPTTAEELGALAKRAIPWLETLWQELGPRSLWLTGSLLTELANDSATAVGRADDTDVWCSRENLEPFARLICDHMRRAWPGCSVSRVDLNSTHLKLWALPQSMGDFHPAALRCDLYANSAAQVRKYHTPAVRCAFDGFSELVMQPSCAFAWATRVNVDFKGVRGSKSACLTWTRKWLLGFNFACSWAEYVRFASFMRNQAADVKSHWQAALRQDRAAPQVLRVKAKHF